MRDIHVVHGHVRFLLFRICGEPLAFLIEVNGQRIYIDSGGTLRQLPPNEQVGLAILRMALHDFRGGTTDYTDSQMKASDI
jgi:hypothetical protein